MRQGSFRVASVGVNRRTVTSVSPYYGSFRIIRRSQAASLQCNNKSRGRCPFIFHVIVIMLGSYDAAMATRTQSPAGSMPWILVFLVLHS